MQISFLLKSAIRTNRSHCMTFAWTAPTTRPTMINACSFLFVFSAIPCGSEGNEISREMVTDFLTSVANNVDSVRGKTTEILESFHSAVSETLIDFSQMMNAAAIVCHGTVDQTSKVACGKIEYLAAMVLISLGNDLNKQLEKQPALSQKTAYSYKSAILGRSATICYTQFQGVLPDICKHAQAVAQRGAEADEKNAVIQRACDYLSKLATEFLTVMAGRVNDEDAMRKMVGSRMYQFVSVTRPSTPLAFASVSMMMPDICDQDPTGSAITPACDFLYHRASEMLEDFSGNLDSGRGDEYTAAKRNKNRIEIKLHHLKPFIIGICTKAEHGGPINLNMPWIGPACHFLLNHRLDLLVPVKSSNNAAGD